MDTGYYVHPNALCESDQIGHGTRVWAFAHVMKDARIGCDCNIGDGAFVESGVVIGDRVTIKNGVCVWNGVTVHDDVFLGPNCVLTNDLLPRSRVFHEENVPTVIGRGASIGANATIVAGNTLGAYCMIGAGAVVTRDVPDFALVIGNPARPAGWVGVKGERLNFTGSEAEEETISTPHGLYIRRGGVVLFQPDPAAEA